MRKYIKDLILILSIVIIATIAIIILNITAKKDNLIAYVYHNSDIVLEIKLDELDSDTLYCIDGDISSVTILANNSGVKIIESDCSDKTCINQGLISNSNQTITCLPNKIYIVLKSNDSEVDIVI